MWYYRKLVLVPKQILNDEHLSIPGYGLVSANLTNTKHEGVCICCRESLPLKLCSIYYFNEYICFETAFDLNKTCASFPFSYHSVKLAMNLRTSSLTMPKLNTTRFNSKRISTLNTINRGRKAKQRPKEWDSITQHLNMASSNTLRNRFIF